MLHCAASHASSHAHGHLPARRGHAASASWGRVSGALGPRRPYREKVRTFIREQLRANAAMKVRTVDVIVIARQRRIGGLGKRNSDTGGTLISAQQRAPEVARRGDNGAMEEAFP